MACCRIPGISCDRQIEHPFPASSNAHSRFAVETFRLRDFPPDLSDAAPNDDWRLAVLDASGNTAVIDEVIQSATTVR
jgi:hypothetical protein